MNTIEYPLLALIFTKEECKSIMVPILKGGLQKDWDVQNATKKVGMWCSKKQEIGVHTLFTN